MANAKINSINTTISDADYDAINMHLQAVKNILFKYTKTVTPEEKKGMHKAGIKDITKAGKALELAGALAAGFNAETIMIAGGMNNDITLHKQMRSIRLGLVNQIVSACLQTEFLTANEAKTAALAIYKYISTGAQIGLDGFSSAAEVLKNTLTTNASGRPKELKEP